MHGVTTDAHITDRPATDVINRPLRTIYGIAAGLVLMAVIMGSVVCATESGAACPTWPGCYPDQFVPEFEVNPLIEFFHRVGAMGAAPFVLAASLMGRQLPASMTAARRLPWVALVGASMSGVMGMLTILTGLPRWAAVIDLLAALVAMIAMVVAALSLRHRGRMPSPRPLLARVAWAAVAMLLVVHGLGIVVAGSGSFTRCMGWPQWHVLTDDHLPAIQGARISFAAAVILLMLVALALAWRSAVLRTWALLAVALVVAEITLGAQIDSDGLSSGVAAIHATIAVLIVWVLAVLAALAGFREPRDADRT